MFSLVRKTQDDISPFPQIQNLTPLKHGVQVGKVTSGVFCLFRAAPLLEREGVRIERENVCVIDFFLEK